jgi:hypothetical protein
MIAYLANLLSSPVVAKVLIPALSRALTDLFLKLADRAESRASIIQAKAAGQIAENAARAEALRAASKRLSDNTQR